MNIKQDQSDESNQSSRRSSQLLKLAAKNALMIQCDSWSPLVFKHGDHIVRWLQRLLALACPHWPPQTCY